MDLSKIGRSLWIAIGGTVAVFLGIVVFPWYSASFGPITVDAYAWDVNFWGKLAFLGMLLMIAGVVVLLLPNPPDLSMMPIPVPMALLAVSAFTALMVIIEYIDHNSYVAFGLWLTLIGALVGGYGAFELGGRLSLPTGSGTSSPN